MIVSFVDLVSYKLTSLILERKKSFFIVRLTYNCYKNKTIHDLLWSLNSRSFRKMASLDWNFKSVAIWLPPYFRHQAPSLVIPGYVCEKYIHFFFSPSKKSVYWCSLQDWVPCCLLLIQPTASWRMASFLNPPYFFCWLLYFGVIHKFN